MRWECERRPGTADGDDAILQRLAQHLQHIPRELRQFVKEQYAVVGKADFPRLRDSAPSNQTAGGYRMVRRTKRAALDQTLSGVIELAGRAVDFRDL